MNSSIEQLPLDFSHSTKFYSDDLVVTQSNKAAYELIEQWPNWLMPVAVLIGPKGSGKTHFTSVWANVTGAKILQAGKMEEAMALVSNGQPVAIEDVDSQPIDDTAFFHLINSVKQANVLDCKASLLLTASTSPLSWNVSLSDLISRLRSLTLATIEQPDDELLASVAFKLFSDRQIKVDAQVINFLVSRCERSLFALSRVVAAIDHLALQRKSKVTRALVSEVMQDFAS